MSTTSRSELRSKEWKDPQIRSNRVEGIRKGAKRRYSDPEERRKSSERAKAFYARNSESAKKNRERIRELGKSQLGSAKTANGLAGTPEYTIWIAMNQRCHNPNARYYENYGGRGIFVCKEWRGRGGFACFHEHVGDRPTPDHSIGRIDNDGNYEPGNVRWETKMEQAANSRRNHYVTINGERKHIAEWSRLSGIGEMTINNRIKRGWSEERLLDPPQERDRSGLTQDGRRLITINGETKSVTEWSRFAGLKPKVISGRLKRGWTGKQLLEPTISPRGHTLTIGSETKYVSEWAEIAGIPRRALQFRITKGWPEDRLLIPLRKPRDKKVICHIS